MTLGEIPLFPLRAVLLPGSPLRLRIFEARYLDMVGACLKSGIDFGIIGIASGEELGSVETFSVGTTAQVVDWDRGSDGILGLAVVGRQRFAVESQEREKSGLYRGRVLLRRPEASVPIAADQDWVQAIVRAGAAGRAGEAQSSLESNLADANWLSWRLADILPLSLSEKQSVLETDDVGERIGLLRPKADTYLAARTE